MHSAGAQSMARTSLTTLRPLTRPASETVESTGVWWSRVVEILMLLGCELDGGSDARCQGAATPRPPPSEVCLSDCSDRRRFHTESWGGQDVGLSRRFRW
jgi:hypothetical protein